MMSVMGERGQGVGEYLAASQLLVINWLLKARVDGSSLQKLLGRWLGVADLSRRYLRRRRRRWLLRRRGGCVTLLLLLLLLLRIVIGESLSMQQKSGTAGRHNLQSVP